MIHLGGGGVEGRKLPTCYVLNIGTTSLAFAGSTANVISGGGVKQLNPRSRFSAIEHLTLCN